MKPDRHECEEQVRQPQMMNRWRKCERTGVVYREGKWWCKQHDPAEKVRRAFEKQKREDTKMSKSRQEWNDRRVGAVLRMDNPSMYQTILKGLD